MTMYPKAIPMHRNHLVTAVVLGVLSYACNVAPARATPDYIDDTEVFRDQSNVTTGNPNILFVVDTGSEMGQALSGPTNLNPVTQAQKTRMQAVKDAVINVLTRLNDENVGVNIGFMRLSVNGSGGSAAAKGGVIARAVQPLTTTSLEDFKYALCVPTAVSPATTRDVLLPDSDCLHSLPNGTGQSAESRFVFGTQDQMGSGAMASPLTEMLFEAYLYYSGKSVLWGSPLSGQVGPGYGYTSEPLSITTASCGPILVNNGVPQCKNISSGIYQSPISQTCQKNFIIVLSDGVMAEDQGDDVGTATKNVMSQPGFSAYTGANTGSAGSGKCSLNYMPNTTTEIKFSGGKKTSSCPDDLAYYMDQHGVGTKNVPVTTYVIGFDIATAAGSEAAKATALLQMVATAGGGKFFTSSDQVALEDALRGTINEIVIQNASFSSPAVAVNAFNRTQNLDALYMSVFSPEVTMHWPGNVKKYKLASNGDILDAELNSAVGSNGFFRAGRRSFWTPTTVYDGDDAAKGGAASQLPTPATRKIYTNTTDGTTQLASDSSLDQHDLSDLKDLSTSTQDALLGITCTTQTSPIASPTCPSAAQLIDWAYGADVSDRLPLAIANPATPAGNGTVDEPRYEMGDPLHARPAVVIYDGPATAPESRVYTITNDGYLHAIDAADGHEKWAFVPFGQLNRLLSLYQNNTVGPPRQPLGLDGNIRVLKLDRCGDGVINTGSYNAANAPCEGDKVYLYFGMRRGGSYYYALDVTSKDSPKLMWIDGPTSDSSLGSNNQLPLIGQTWSTPAIAKASVPGKNQTHNGLDDNYVLVFGGGYDTAVEDGIAPKQYQTDTVGTGIYMVDAVNGHLLWRAGPSGGTGSPDLPLSSMTNAIPADVRPLDFTGDGFVDLIYAADLGGRIWRLEVNNAASSMSNFVKGGVFASLGSTGSVTNARRFFNAPDVSYVKVGTSSWYNIAIGSGNRELPVTDQTTDDKFYSLRDYNKLMPYTWSGGGAWTPLTDSSLVDVTPVATTNADGSTSYSQSAVPSDASGWKLTLDYFAGEKVITESRTFESTVFFSSFYPKQRTGDDDTDRDSCTVTKGYNNLYTVSVVNATACATCISGLVNKGKTVIASGLGVILKQPGIAPEPVFLFPGSNGPTRVPPVCLVGAESCGTYGSYEPKRTFWLQKGAE
jgi:type IV pilus assembly protein PilY1